MVSILENMGIFGEGREQAENVEGQNCVPNQSTSVGSPSYDQTLSFTDTLEEQREPIPSVENPLRAEVHAKETIGEENQAATIGQMDPLDEENPTYETLGGEN